MKVSNTMAAAAKAWQNAPSNRKGTSFSELLREKNTQVTVLQDGTVRIMRMGELGDRGQLHRVYCNVGDYAEPVKADIGRLAEEKRAELNEKYQFEDMRHGSKEYYELISELCGLGVFSKIPYAIPADVLQANISKGGWVTGVLEKVGDGEKDWSVKEYYANTLGNAEGRYKELSKKTSLTDEERIFTVLYQSHQNVSGALEDIFHGQPEK